MYDNAGVFAIFTESRNTSYLLMAEPPLEAGAAQRTTTWAAVTAPTVGAAGASGAVAAETGVATVAEAATIAKAETTL